MRRYKKKKKYRQKRAEAKPATPKEETFMLKLMKDLSLSLKRHKKFGSFIYGFLSLEKYVKNEHEWRALIWGNRNRNYPILVGDDVIMHSLPYVSSGVNTQLTYAEHFKNGGMIYKLIILYLLLRYYRCKDTKLSQREILGYFASNEVAKMKKERKIYPNEFVFKFLFGTIAASICIILIATIVSVFFSPNIGLVFTLFILVMLVIARLLILFNEINLAE